MNKEINAANVAGNWRDLPAACTMLNVPPLQGGDFMFRTFSWAFSPSYNMAGFQPNVGKGPVKRNGPARRADHVKQIARSRQQPADRHITGLQARHVIARAGGPGTTTTTILPAL